MNRNGSPVGRNHRFRLLVLSVLIGLPVFASAQHFVGELRTVMENLASGNGFSLVRGSRLGTESARAASGELRERLGVLLADYSYIITTGDDGSVEKVLILGLKQARPQVTDSVAIPTTRQNSHHIVMAELVGAGEKTIQLALMVDTGATSIVLPMSMTTGLGFTASELQSGSTQTANGKVEAKQAVLNGVRVGEAAAENVAVTFVDDDKLGGNMLLGMSFLGRFQMTIDDSKDQLILKRR